MTGRNLMAAMNMDQFVANFSGDLETNMPVTNQTGETLLLVNHKTGEMTYGADRIPLPQGSVFVVPVSGFRIGYKVWKNKKPIENHMVALGSGLPTPEPRTHYTPYPEDGPRQATELVLHSLEERGFSCTLAASPSSARRVADLAKKVRANFGEERGQSGFAHPVIEARTETVRSDTWGSTYWVFAPVVIDWMHHDGERLWSQKEHYPKVEAKASSVDTSGVTREEIDALM